ncbi:hypothetical protein [Lysobacter gummosus]
MASANQLSVGRDSVSNLRQRSRACSRLSHPTYHCRTRHRRG